MIRFREPVKLEEWIALDAALVVDAVAEGGDDGGADDDPVTRLAALADNEDADSLPSENRESGGEENGLFYSTLGLGGIVMPMAVYMEPIPFLELGRTFEINSNFSGMNGALTIDCNTSPTGYAGAILDSAIIAQNGYYITNPTTPGSQGDLLSAVNAALSNYAPGDDITADGVFTYVIGNVSDSAAQSALSGLVDFSVRVDAVAIAAEGAPIYTLTFGIGLGTPFLTALLNAGRTATLTLRFNDGAGGYFDLSSVNLVIPSSVTEIREPQGLKAYDGGEGENTDDGLGDTVSDPFGAEGGGGSSDFAYFLFSLDEEEEEIGFADDWETSGSDDGEPFDLSDLTDLLESESLADSEAGVALQEGVRALARLREEIQNLRDGLDSLDDDLTDEWAERELAELIAYAEGKAAELERGILNLAAAARTYIGLDVERRDGIVLETLEALSNQANLLIGQADAMGGAFGVLTEHVVEAGVNRSSLTAESISSAYSSVSTQKLRQWTEALSRRDPYSVQSAVAGLKQQAEQ